MLQLVQAAQVSEVNGAGQCPQRRRPVFGVGSCATRSSYKADLRRKSVG